VRTERICGARNRILLSIAKSQKKADFLIMMDLDDVCTAPLRVERLVPFLVRTDWDVLSFHHAPPLGYYDIWALAYDDYVMSCWNFGSYGHCRYVVDTMKARFAAVLESMSPDELVPVLSAFNGFAIYKWPCIDKCWYRWKSPEIESYDAAQLARNRALLDVTWPFTFRLGKEDCEHRGFHEDIRQKHKAKIMVSPVILFER
jgi:hypothetical protein